MQLCRAGMLCNISAARELGHEGADVPLHLYGPLGLGRFLAAAMQLSDTYLLCPVLIHELVPGPVPGRDADHEVRTSLTRALCSLPDRTRGEMFACCHISCAELLPG